MIKARKITKKNTFSIKTRSIKIAKAKCRIQHKKNNEKGLHTLINNSVYCKAMEKLRNRIDVKLGNQNQVTCHKKYLTII